LAVFPSDEVAQAMDPPDKAPSQGAGPRSPILADTSDEPLAPTAELVQAVRSGDRQAFATLYRQHAPAVRVVVGGSLRDPELVADAVQEVFTRALEALASLRDAERFRPWLLSIARHVAVDTLRSGARTGPWDDELAQGVESFDPEPSDLAELAELAALVRGVVGGLSRRDATAITLLDLGFGLDDVSAALGLSRGAAKVAVHRARRRLRDALVLQVMVGKGEADCPTFRSLSSAGAYGDLIVHVRECDICSGPARPPTP